MQELQIRGNKHQLRKRNVALFQGEKFNKNAKVKTKFQED